MREAREIRRRWKRPLAADVQLIGTILALETTHQLTDAEGVLYAGIATLGAVGDLALHNDLGLLGTSVGGVVANAVGNIETGLQALPHHETRSLNGAIHVFEAHIGDLVV